MAERAASVPYSGVPDVQSGGGGGTPMDTSASPNAFGAQIGGALEKGGAEVGNVANKFTGMIMETAANQAETSYIAEAGKITGKFKSLEGLEAQVAIPQYEQDMINLRQSIRSSLPGQAARMFDATTNRHESYALSDAYGYGAQQVKKATLDSNNAVAQTAISRAGDSSVADDDARFGGVIGDIKHSVASMMELQGYGQHTTTDASGKVSFSDTPGGQQAKTVYQSELDKRTGMAWENRLHVLADQNVQTAYDKYQQNKDQIPGEAQVTLDAFFTPKVKDYQARNDADSILAKHNQEYQQTLVNSKGAGMALEDAIHTQESGGKPHDYQIQEGTFTQYARPGEKFDNPQDQDAVYGRIITDLKKSYPNDPARQAVAYFSGKGNVSPADSTLPYIKDSQDANGKSVSSYVADITRRMVGGQKIQSASLVPSLADYYRSNYDKIIDETRQQAQSQHPDDPNYADTAVAKISQRMHQTIQGQELAYKADNDTVVKAFNGDFSKGARPTTVEQLRAASPDAASAWDRLTVNNPMAANAIENRILTANSKGNYNASNPVGYSAAEHRVFLPRSDPNAITDEAQLWPLVANGTITGKDRDNLAKTLVDIQDPKNKTELSLKKNVVDSALNAILPAKLRNSGFSSPDMDSRMQSARIAIQQADEDAIKAGKTAQQRYSPDSKDYVGSAARPFLLTPAQKLSEARTVSTAIKPPEIGTVSKGYSYIGGDPAAPNSWKHIE